MYEFTMPNKFMSISFNLSTILKLNNDCKIKVWFLIGIYDYNYAIWIFIIGTYR